MIQNQASQAKGPPHSIHDLQAQHSPMPLAGLVVFELGNSVAAPFCGQILGELGAKVIKVEKPSGDDARKWGPPFWEGSGAYFQSLNRNKQSIVCDFHDPQQLDQLKQLVVEQADIVVQNMRPGQVEKLGLDAKSLSTLKPNLIYCNFGAFGSSGPLSQQPGYDPLMQAFSGIMSTTGEPGRPTVRVGASIVDLGTGLWGIIGILTALYERQKNNLGKTVDVSLFETATSWVSLIAAQYLASNEVPTRQGSGAKGIVPYKAYTTTDGEIVIAAGSDALFLALCEMLGHTEWSTNPDFKDNPSRVANSNKLYALIESLILTKSTQEWLVACEAYGIPASAVQNIEQMIQHPQTKALGIVQNIPNSKMSFIGLPISFNGQRPQIQTAPPKLGEHTNIYLRETDHES